MPVRIIAHVLQKTGYVSAFIELSYFLSCWVTVHECKRAPNGPFHLAIPLVTLHLVFRYGAFLRREISLRSWWWLAGAGFYFGAPRLVGFYNPNWENFLATFTPPVMIDHMLESIGYLYPGVMRFWMPVAGVLSVVAWVLSGGGRVARAADGGGAGGDRL